MCGGSGGFDIGAFNPFADWKHKKGLDKFASLAGLPIGNAIASPKWIKAHPKEAAAAALIAGTVLTGGALGGAAGGAAAGGVGATEAGAAAAGSGAMLGSTLGGAGFSMEAGAAAPWLAEGVGSGALAGSTMGGAGFGLEAGPLITEAAPAYGGELASVGDAGGTMLGGAAPQSVTALPGDWKAPLDAWERTKGLFSGANVKGGLRGAYLANSLMSKQQTPMPAATRPAPQAFAPLADSLKPIYGQHLPQPGDPDYLEYLRRKQYGY